MKIEKYKIDDFKEIFSKALCFVSEHSSLCCTRFPAVTRLLLSLLGVLSGDLARRGPPRAALCGQ
eukprot:4708544-Pyramimonas_sp.AAC.1